MNEEVKDVVGFLLQNKVLLTILPALSINLIIDIIKKPVKRSGLNNTVTFSSSLVLLGIVYGLAYYHIFEIDKIASFLYGMAICVCAHIFYKVQIWEELKDLVLSLLKRIKGGSK